MAKSRNCGECEVEFSVIIEQDVRGFFPVIYCPFCGTDLYEDETEDELNFDENDEE
jgi:predicted  nucleic acid-binding Zn-ribbon protein